MDGWEVLREDQQTGSWLQQNAWREQAVAIVGVFERKQRNKTPPETIQEKMVLHENPKVNELLWDLAKYEALIRQALWEIREDQRVKREGSDQANHR